MIGVLRRAGLLWPLVLAVIGLAILIALGNWQMRRMAWKAELIELVDNRVKSEPISFEALKQRAGAAGGDIRYQPVRVSGRFLHDEARYYFLPLGSKVGWHILTPLRTDGGDVVFIDRGFVPDQLLAEVAETKARPEGEVTITGLAREFEAAGLFTPANNVKENKWYWRDGAGLYKSLAGATTTLPFMIDQRERLGAGEWPKPGVTRVQFSDKHFGYALTWYGLALTLVGVFFAFAYQRLKRGLKRRLGRRG